MYNSVARTRLAQIVAKITNQRYVYLSSPLDAAFREHCLDANLASLFYMLNISYEAAKSDISPDTHTCLVSDAQVRMHEWQDPAVGSRHGYQLAAKMF